MELRQVERLRPASCEAPAAHQPRVGGVGGPSETAPASEATCATRPGPNFNPEEPNLKPEPKPKPKLGRQLERCGTSVKINRPSSKFLTLFSFLLVAAHLALESCDRRTRPIISTISCDLLLIEQSNEPPAVGDRSGPFQQALAQSADVSRVARFGGRLTRRARRLAANNAAIFAPDQRGRPAGATAAGSQLDASSSRALKVAALASKLDHWLQCQRLNLLDQQQQQQQQHQHLQDQDEEQFRAQQRQQHQQTQQVEASSKESLNSSSALMADGNQDSQARAKQRPPAAKTPACAAHFDGHLCWPRLRVGQRLQLACPKINYQPLERTGAQLEPTGAAGLAAPLFPVIDQSQLISRGASANQTPPPTSLEPIIKTAAATINQAETEADEQRPASGVATATAGKFARRQCGPSETEQTIGQWQLEADYSECRDQSELQSAPFDATDEWLKLSEPADRKLFDTLKEQLERIEVSIDPYLEPDLLEQWQICIGEIVRQQQTGQPESLTSSGERQCPIIFDGWRCWPATRAGEVAYVSCPSNQPGFSAERKAHKICTLEGDWYRHPMTNRYWSNYTTCVDTVDLAFRTKILNLYVSGNLISLIALTMSLIIFVSFESLKCTRVTIHKNLFLSFIINNLMWVVWYIFVVNNADILQSNPVGCRFWHILLHYFLVSNYFWMFCEGLYLHTILVVAFVSEDKILKWFYMLGWLTPLPITLAYAYNRSYDDYYTSFCWMEESPYNIILMAPIGLSLLLNLVFLINIVRVLVTKLRANNSPDTHQTRKAVRATLILIPLLGLHYILTPFRPEAKSEWEVIYEIIAAVCTSFQGLCVAMLFCLCNGEVMSAIRKKLKDTCFVERKNKHRAMRSRSNTAVSNVFNYSSSNTNTTSMTNNSNNVGNNNNNIGLTR